VALLGAMLGFLPVWSFAAAIPKAGWSVEYVTSQETVGGNTPATNVFDGNPNTFWHSQWFNGLAVAPHELQLDLGTTYSINQIRYTPRQDSGNGRVGSYRIFISQDGVHWGAPAAEGVFPNTKDVQTINIPATAGRYLSMFVLNDVNGGGISAIAEIDLFGDPLSPSRNEAPDSFIASNPVFISLPVGGRADFSGFGLDVDNGAPFSYRWKFGAASGIADATVADPPPVTFNTAGEYVVTFQVTDSAGVADATPDSVRVRVGPGLLNPSPWNVWFVDSQEAVGSDGRAINAFDGKPGTIWHSKWYNGTDPIPHQLQIDLGAPFTISEFRYLPRQDGPNGRIKDYRFFVSQDGLNWGAPIASGVFPNTATERVVTVPPTSGRYVALMADSEVNGSPITTVAEFNLFAQPALPEQMNLAPDGIITSHPTAQEISIGPGGVVDFSGIGLDLNVGQALTYSWNFGVGSGIPLSNLANPAPVQFMNEGTFTTSFTVTDSSGASDLTPDIRVVKVGISSIPASLWTILSSSSQEMVGSDTPASKIFDGNPGTFWHSKWLTGSDPVPHEIILDLGKSYTLNAFTYLPRQDSANGRIGAYAFYVGQDGVNWGSPAVTGTFPPGSALQTVPFAPVSGRYVRFLSYGDQSGSPYSAMAELGFRGFVADPNVNQAPNGVILTPGQGLAIPPGASVEFAGLGSDLNVGQSLSYLWNFGAGSGVSNSTSESPGMVTFPNEGTFNVTFTVTDNQGASDPTPGKVTLTVGTGLIDRTGWSIHGASSQQTEGANLSASNILDGNPNTFWHTRYSPTLASPPHYVDIDLGANYTLTGLKYLPRQDIRNGRMDDYKITVSQDGTHWGAPAGTGNFVNSAAAQTATFPAASGRYVRLTSTKDVAGAPVIAAAEIDLLGYNARPVDNQAPDGVITSPAGNLIIAPGDTVNFAGLGLDLNAGQGRTYAWNFGPGSGIAPSTVASPGNVTFNNNGVYEVTLTVTDAAGVVDPTPAKVVINVGGSTLSKSNFVIRSVNSEQTSGYGAINVLDGNPATFWHSKFSPTTDPLPHEIVVDLGGTYLVNEMTYLPRQDLPNGRIGAYEVVVSLDGIHFGGAVASGTFMTSAAQQVVPLTPTMGRYVMLRSFGDANGNPATTVAELDFGGQTPSSSINQAPDGTIDSPANNLAVAVGADVNFTGTGLDADNNLPLTYLWNFGSGSGIPNSNLKNPGVLHFPFAGAFDVTLTVTDSKGLADPTPHKIRVNVGAAALNRSGWTVHSVSSQETVASNNGANLVFDGNPATFWHTKYAGGIDPHPHTLDINLGGNFIVAGFTYLARQDVPNGRVAAYQFYVSQDGVHWGAPAVEGVLANSATQQNINFPTATAGRYVRFVSLSEINGNPVTSMAELNVLGQEVPGGINQAPDGVIDTPLAGVRLTPGGQANFTATGLDVDNSLPLNYHWNFGAGSGVPDSTLRNPGLIQFNNVGVFEVTLTVTDSLGLADPTPHKISVLVSAGDGLIGKGGWTLLGTNSQETTAIDGKGSNAFDGNPDTFWHTRFSNGLDPTPHTLDVDLGSMYNLAEFRYLPRQDQTNGRINAFTIHLSSDGVNWGAPVAKGNFVNSTAEQKVKLPGLPARYVRLVGDGDVNGNTVTAVAEINLLGQPRPAFVNDAPHGWITYPARLETFNIKQGDQVRFDAVALDIDGDTPLTYRWNFGASSGIPDQTKRQPDPVIYNQIGNHTVTFTVTDARGRVNQVSDTRVIKVEGGGPTNPAPNGTINYPHAEIAVPVGGTVDLSGSGTDPNSNLPLTYRWEFGAGSGIADQTVADPSVVQYNVAGVYSLRFTVTDSQGLPDPTPATLTVRVGANVLIPRTQWALTFVDSQETVSAPAPASNILDGNAATYWHTAYTGGVVPGPHEVQIDLGARYAVSGFRYLPRQDSNNGHVGQYQFYVSEDGATWNGPVAQGAFPESMTEQQITFPASAARYVRFVAVNEINGGPLTTMAELNVLQTPQAALAAPATALANIAEASGYQLVYRLDPAAANDFRTNVPYVTNNSLAHPDGTFERVAYFVELGTKWVWVSFDAASDSTRDIGVPVAARSWQSRKVRNMNVFSSAGAGVTTGSGITTGNIEFWSTSYGPQTVPGIPGGSNTTLDFNDTYSLTGSHGSMQIHNYGAGQTIFAFNNWNTTASNSDLGIGNSPGANPDWTFSANAGTYASRRIYVLVKRGTYGGQADINYTSFPAEKSLAPRNVATNKATVAVAGAETRGGFEHVRLRTYRNGVPYGSVLTLPLTYSGGQAPFTFSPTIDAELAEYEFALSLLVGPNEVIIRRSQGVVAGDAYLVNGQSNADAQKYNGSAFAYESPFIRTFGLNTSSSSGTAADHVWRTATGDGSQDRVGGIGQWALVMANLIVSQQGIPVAVINGAHGGQEIGFFQRDETNTESLTSNYGRLLHRVRQAGLQNSLRGAFFYQGEADVDDAGIHDLGFREMRGDWQVDYPTLERIFVFQVREGCDGVSRFDLALRDVQRRFEDRFSHLSVMASNALNSHDGCHFAFTGGYENLGYHIYRQAARSLYGGTNQNVDPPNPASVQLVGTDKLRITFRNATDSYTYEPGVEADFQVVGAPVSVTGGSITGNVLTLQLSGNATNATHLLYGGRQFSGQWVTNANGVGMVSFSEPILPP